jgi:hypothetical protein
MYNPIYECFTIIVVYEWDFSSTLENTENNISVVIKPDGSPTADFVWDDSLGKYILSLNDVRKQHLFY